MSLNVLLALHVASGAGWLAAAAATSGRAQTAQVPRRRLALEAGVALAALGLGFALAALERPDMASAFGQALMAGATLAILAMLLLVALMVWPAARRRAVVMERMVALLVGAALVLMALAHRI